MSTTTTDRTYFCRKVWSCNFNFF